MQIDEIVQGEAKSFKVKIDTVYGPLDLGGYQSCAMYLYDEDDFTTPIVTWDSSNPSRAVFYDRANGIIQFYIVNTDTAALEPKQYSYRMKITRDAEHTYTVHEGILEIKA
jgi:hypothetical protein